MLRVAGMRRRQGSVGGTPATTVATTSHHHPKGAHLSGYTHGKAVQFVWSVADLIRDVYKQHQYGEVILPFVVIRRLDSALEPTRQKVWDLVDQLDGDLDSPSSVARLRKVAGYPFYNTSKLTFNTLTDDPGHLRDNLTDYLLGFSPDARDIFTNFNTDDHIDKLASRQVLYPVVARFGEIDLHPHLVSNTDMGYLFEELIRKFAELQNEDAGHHFTPREVIRLMVDLLFCEDRGDLARTGRIVTMYDPAAGTGGMLSVADQYLAELHDDITLVPHGQELNAESYAICKSDMLIKGQNTSNIVLGNSFTEDGHAAATFDYVIANPPYGVSWKGYADPIVREHEQEGFDGRFGAGLPSKSDGQLLFLQHMISKLNPVKPDGTGGGRVAIVMNGSPLFTGAPGGGESEIRRWVLENDYLEALVGLPGELFYNTGINTWIWVLTNRKPEDRRGTVQLIDARDLFVKMRKSLGNKRNELSQDDIAEIVRLFGEQVDNDRSRIVDNESFGFHRITVERPVRARYDGGAAAAKRLRAHPDWVDLHVNKSTRTEGREDEVREAVEAAVAGLSSDLDLTSARADMKKSTHFSLLLKKSKQAVFDAITLADPDADPLVDAKGAKVADPDLRGYESVPLDEDIDDYVAREVLPHAPAAWVDHDKTKVGYEIPFTRIFYTYEPPRPLAEIDADLKQVEQEILALLAEVTS